MRKKWTRERVIHDILECVSEGLPLTVGEPGISKSLYQAGSRFFGSWRNAIQAAGLRPELGNCVEKWPPARIFRLIRNLARRRHPLNVKQLEQRYGSMFSVARRLFGSWSKAVLAAGVDPTRFRRIVWTRERVIERILIRALRNEHLGAWSIQPQSLVAAGRRFFGTWSAALEVARVDPKTTDFGTVAVTRVQAPVSGTGSKSVQPQRKTWTKDAIIAAIRARRSQQKALNPGETRRDDSALYSAAKRHFGNWRSALIAAGLSPEVRRRVKRRFGPCETPGSVEEPLVKPQVDDAMRPDEPA
jgi:hypothetical protein